MKRCKQGNLILHPNVVHRAEEANPFQIISFPTQHIRQTNNYRHTLCPYLAVSPAYSSNQPDNSKDDPDQNQEHQPDHKHQIKCNPPPAEVRLNFDGEKIRPLDG